MNKNVPNIICWIRIGLIPFVLLFLLDNPICHGISSPTRILISGIIFGVAMLSDMIDGKIARKYNSVTNFGKFLDPIADKLLVIGVLAAFIEKNWISSIPLILILAREFMITGLRIAAMSKGKVVAANIWGKIKTTIQGIVMGGIFLYSYIMGLLGFELGNVINISVWFLAVITIISVIPYYKSCKKYLKD